MLWKRGEASVREIHGELQGDLPIVQATVLLGSEKETGEYVVP